MTTKLFLKIPLLIILLLLITGCRSTDDVNKTDFAEKLTPLMKSMTDRSYHQVTELGWKLGFEDIVLIESTENSSIYSINTFKNFNLNGSQN